MLNFGSFAASASVSGISALRDVDATWVYNSPPTVSAAALLSKVLQKTPHVLHVMDLWPDSIVAAGFARQGMLLVSSDGGSIGGVAAPIVGLTQWPTSRLESARSWPSEESQ